MLTDHTIVTSLQSGLFIFMGIAGIGFLIGFHELGHFLFCKLFKIRTPSFSIGMGPKLISKKIGETTFVLSAIPLGGYVEIAGAAEVGQGDQKEAFASDDGAFSSKPYYQKLLVMLGGITFNLAFAYVALSALFFTGMPKSPLIYPALATKTISEILPDSPASRSQLLVGDTITAINNSPVKSAIEIIETVQKNPGKNIIITFERNKTIRTTPVTLGSRELPSKQDVKKTVGFLGLEFSIPRYNGLEAVKQGFHTTNMIMCHVGQAFKNIFAKGEYNNLGGPIAVLSDTIKSASKGFKVFLLLLAFISINLAILNLIPLPIFDGGQLLFYTIEAVIRKPLPNKIREYIHIATWLSVIALALYLSFKDIMRLL